MEYEHEVRKLKVFCITFGCMNRQGGQKSVHRNLKDFSPESKLAAIESIKAGTRINATTAYPTQGQWIKTPTGWLCPDCK